MDSSPLIDLNDVAVALGRKSDAELRRMEWLFGQMNRRWLVNIGSTFTLLALRLRLPVEGIIRRTVFQQFCGGTNLDECARTAAELGKHGVLTVLDYGAEGKQCDADFDKTAGEFVRALQFAAAQPSVPIISCKVTGLTPFSLLEKISSGAPLSESDKTAYRKAFDRLDGVCAQAERSGVGLFIDAEESWIQDAIDQMTNEMMERYNRSSVVVYNTFQLYRHDRLDYLKKSYLQAQEKGYLLGAKLVRGAYMEKERARADKLSYHSPIQPNKTICDRDYDSAVVFCVQHHDKIGSCLASHNAKSTLLQVELMQQLGIAKDHPHLSFCQLYGMSDNLTFNLAKAGYRVAKYVPYGPVRDVVPYLIRRARENSATGNEVSRELQLIRKEIARRKASK